MSTKKTQKPTASRPATPVAKAVGRSPEEFKAAYDKSYIVPAKIKAAIAKLGGGWAYELEFAKLAGLSMTDIGNYRAQFEDHVVIINREGKRAWAGTKVLASRMKEMLR